MEDILKNKYDKETVKAIRERPEYTYTVSGDIQRTSVLDIVRVVKDDTWHYAAFVENRPLTSLCKLVDCPISLESGNAEVLVTKEDFKIHFEVRIFITERGERSAMIYSRFTSVSWKGSFKVTKTAGTNMKLFTTEKMKKGHLPTR